MPKPSFRTLPSLLSVMASVIHHGPASEGIIFVADEVGADLIIMGSHGRTGVKRLLLGSVARAVLTESHIPVLIVKQ